MRLDALAEVQRSTGVLAFLYSPASFALAPLTRRLRVLRAGEMMRGPAEAAEPLLLREQLLYQSLYLGTHLWVAAGRAKPGPGLERHVADALEACGYFASGTLSPDARGARATLAPGRVARSRAGRAGAACAGTRAARRHRCFSKSGPSRSSG